MGKNKKKKTHIPLRINLLFFAVFILFAALIFRLGYVQIVHGEDAKRELDRTEDVTVSTSVPRGLIYDRDHQPVVGNQAERAITYTAPKKFDQEKTLETAKKLATLIEQKTDKITERDQIDFWILLHPDEAKAKLTKEEWDEYKDEKAAELQRERVTDEDLAMLSDDDLEVLAIYREFTKGYALDPQIVKNKDVSLEEFARVSENLHDLPGVDTTMDWQRTYPFKDTLRTILGNVNSGLPAEKLAYYEAHGYSRSDRVGKSYLELQYEDVLQGQKEKVKNVTKSGQILETDIVSEGARGKDLVLTTDMELQQKVDEIIEDELRKTKANYGGTQLLDRAFVTLMNPFTGEILALSGKQYTYDEDEKQYVFRDFASGNFTTAYAPGSAVKGATVLTGFMTGVNKPGDTILDEPLYFHGATKSKSSWFNRGGSNQWMNEKDALRRSSNVYMFKTAMRIGGVYNYSRGDYLSIDKVKTVEKMRYYFNQFGLGAMTGIDLPGEMPGYKGDIANANAGNALDFAIGQYDTFTNLQLAQYVSTIANGGYRMQPHIVKEIREPGEGEEKLGAIAQEIKPKALNRIDATKGEIESVQDGFWRVVHSSGGTGTALGENEYKKLRIAAKTGTAETYDQGQSVWNLSLVAYAPYENPEIAMSIIVPSAYLDGATENKINSDIGKRVMKAYFDLMKERED
ncbi:peptidoglycan D,D-transpeptidase FtsI family protein [Bacillus sp. SD088]|uniref:peptidoglycan D,D-transpeptidase FtsI family protein n=1 Tax=Bacillus sp. SD088 TaxID=2782012 RepID=UPI001A976946|nr:penicillin-binding protein 2 [Bacillus sp. SD088]MBO0995238.1 penicillin-binding protein 2 [Bacillus sp. SD088]